MPACLQFCFGFSVKRDLDLNPYANDVVRQEDLVGEDVGPDGPDPNDPSRAIHYVVSGNPFDFLFLPWMFGVLYWHFPAEEDDQPNIELNYLRDKEDVHVIQLHAPFSWRWILCSIAYILWQIPFLWDWSGPILISFCSAILACLLLVLAKQVADCPIT